MGRGRGDGLFVWEGLHLECRGDSHSICRGQPQSPSQFYSHPSFHLTASIPPNPNPKTRLCTSISQPLFFIFFTAFIKP